MEKTRLFLITFLIIASLSLTGQVSISTTGNSPEACAMLDVQSTDKGILFPRLNINQIKSIIAPVAGLVVYNTDSTELNLFNGVHWVRLNGDTAFSLAIGDYYRGGIIFYLDGSGGGMVCSINDVCGGGGINWSCTFIVTGASGTAIGAGLANTIAIIANHGAGTYAANLCDNYTVGSYSDWFLPSKDELNEMYLNKVAIDSAVIENGGTAFENYNYWSSTELDENNSWDQNFTNGAQNSISKFSAYLVRAVQAF